MAARRLAPLLLLLTCVALLFGTASRASAQFTITASAGAGGSITPSGAVSVDDGADQSFAITADPGHHIVDVLVDGASVGAVPSYEFLDVDADHTIAASFAIDTHTITASAGAGGSITPSGVVSVDDGAEQSFAITAGPGHHIVDVLVDGASVGPVASHDFLAVTADHTIQAAFAIDTHTITASAGAGGSITPSGVVSVDDGADQSFAIAADPGHHIVDVLVDGASVGAVPSFEFLDVDADHTIAAAFAIDNHTITASAGAGGSITPSGVVSVDDGADQSFAITADAGHHITDVLVDGASVGPVASHDFLAVTADHTIEASFAIDTHTITASADPGGSITPSGDVSVDDGADQSFTIASDPGHHIVDVLVDGASVGPVASHGFLSVTADHTIDASFAIDTHTITASAGAGGSITPSGAVGVDDGADQAFAITADSGHHIVDVLIDGASVGAVASYDFIDVTADHTIAAAFAIDTHTITASAGAGGSITPSGAVNVDDGADQSFAIAADAGHHILDVLVDGASVGPVASHDFLSITADHTIEASFAIDTHTITASAGTGGSITPSGVVSLDDGADQSFVIVADPSHHIVDVLVDGASVGPLASYEFFGVTADHTIEASFAIDTHTITASAGAGGSITPNGAVSVDDGADQSFAIAADPGHHITDVFVDGASVGAVPSYEFLDVDADHTIAAAFAIDNHTITASAGAGGSITPSGAVSVDDGTDQSFVIAADPGHHIADVLVDGASVGAVPSYEFLDVDADHTIEASFAIDTHTITATADAGGSITPSGVVSVNDGADQSFAITADAGHHIVDVLVDGASVGAVASHNFLGVTADHTIEASFAIDTHTITASAGAGGSITPSGAVSVDHGADQSFVIVADPSHHIVDVLVDGASVGAMPSYEFLDVNADHTIAASFAIDTHTITASAGAGGSITPSGSIQVPHGGAQLFTLTPSTGYHVVDVLVDGASAGTITSYTFNNVTANHTISASFAFSTHHSSAIALSPDGREGWVVNPDQGTVAVFATQGPNANHMLAQVQVGAEPWTVDVHPTNGQVWVTSLREDKVYVIDAASRTVLTSIPVGFETFGVAFNPAGTIALVTASGVDKIYAIDVANLAVTQTMATYRRPRGIAWKADGTRAWVSHLLMPETIGRLTSVSTVSWTTSPIVLSQVFSLDLGGYPSTMQNLTLAPAPNDTILWIPNNMINTAAGAIAHNPLTPTNIFHAAIRPVGIGASGSDLAGSTYYLSESGTPVGGPIAVDFKNGRGYVANLHSDNVTVLDASNPLSPTELTVIPAGKGPIGVVTHPLLPRAYVANWLSRDVTVIDTGTDTPIATFSTVSQEPLTPSVLHGKQLFYSSKPPLSLDGRGSCASCHVFDRNDSRPWDLTQFGKQLRATPDMRGIAVTGAHDWTSDKDEMQDHNAGIIDFAGGLGLIPFPNPPLGPSNAGLSADMDDMAAYMKTVVPRRGSPYRNADGSMTAEALQGEVIFKNPAVGCASCHVPPYYTDSNLVDNPFVKHIVGTADPTDTDGAAGYDTPSLINVWDSGPYLHHQLAQFPGAAADASLMSVLTSFNRFDQHGVTSILSTQQKSALVAFLLQITWPESGDLTGTEENGLSTAFHTGVDGASPNPFQDATSIKFSLESSPSKVRIDVFDVAGRLVRRLLEREMTRGTHIVGWDARDEAGHQMGAGSYFARLSVNGKATASKRLLIVR